MPPSWKSSFKVKEVAKYWLIGILALVLSGCSLLPGNRNAQGALQVTSPQTFSVFLDGGHLGQTPFFDERIKTGEYVLRLVPIDGDESSAWQTQVQIARRTLTVVNYEPATNPDEASSEILLLEPLANKDETKLTLSTLPDNVVVKLDGAAAGFSPISFDEITAGDHVLLLESPGYKPKEISVKTTVGHHLIVQAQLARDVSLGVEEATSSSVPTATSSAQLATPGEAIEAEEVVDGVVQGLDDAEALNPPYVRILQASPGINWLRVRQEPTGLANNEVARVRVGAYFAYLDISEDEEWYEIEYLPGETGWISAAYGELTE